MYPSDCFRHVIVNTVHEGGNKYNNNNTCVIAILASVQGWFNPRLTLATNICLWLLKTTDVPSFPSAGFCSLHLKTKFLLPGAWLNRKKGNRHSCTVWLHWQRGFHLGRAANKNRTLSSGKDGWFEPAFLREKKQRGRKSFQYVVARPTSLGSTFRAVRVFLLFCGTDRRYCLLATGQNSWVVQISISLACRVWRCWSGRTSCLCASCRSVKSLVFLRFISADNVWFTVPYLIFVYMEDYCECHKWRFIMMEFQKDLNWDWLS